MAADEPLLPKPFTRSELLEQLECLLPFGNRYAERTARFHKRVQPIIAAVARPSRRNSSGSNSSRAMWGIDFTESQRRALT